MVFYDVANDMALLRVHHGENLPGRLELLTTRSSRMGEFVIALGSPGGFEFSASLGIVSALNRKLSDTNTSVAYIQVDAPMYQGSSGGPVVNLSGEVVGMSSRGAAQGVAAFVVPALEIQSFMNRYLSEATKESRQLGFLGAVLQPLNPDLRQYFAMPGGGGILLTYVYPRSAAAEGNLSPGDILLEMDGVALDAKTEDEVRLMDNYISGLGAGVHKVKIWSGKKELTKSIVLHRVAPCQTSSFESDKSTFLLQSSTSCYVLPSGEFVQVSRAWAIDSNARVLEEGDLIINIEGSSENLKDRLALLVHPERSAKGVAVTVLRHGRPILLLLRSS